MTRTREKVTKPCPVCETVFTVDASRMKHGRGVHCSKKCQYIANREKLSGEKVKFVCIGCGTDFERSPSQLVGRNGSGKFCTRKCRDENWKGDITPNWQGGNGVYKRGPNWFSTRRAIIKRDHFKCHQCGSGDDLHVHHIIPFRMFDDYKEANAHDNLITLCAPCHRVEDSKSKWARVGNTITEFISGSKEWLEFRQQADNDNNGEALVA